jgi:hypothetical protein
VPEALDRDIYLVFDNLGGCLGRAWRETQEDRTDRATVIRDLLEGHYCSPVRIIALPHERIVHDFSQGFGQQLPEVSL